MVLVYIHGAGATKNSFNYLRANLSEYKDTCFEYDIQDGFKHNLEVMSAKMKRHKDIFFIAHSMGGMYALHLADMFPNKVLGAVTISTPFGGAEIADYAKYIFPHYRLLRDIGTISRPVLRCKEILVSHPWTQIITTSGSSPWINKANDGVVTVESQKQHSGMEYVELKHTHFEVVLSPTTVTIIKDRISRVVS